MDPEGTVEVVGEISEGVAGVCRHFHEYGVILLVDKLQITPPYPIEENPTTDVLRTVEPCPHIFLQNMIYRSTIALNTSRTFSLVTYYYSLYIAI